MKRVSVMGMVLAAAIPSSGMAQTTSMPLPATVEPLVPAQGTILDVSAEGRTTRVPDLATIRAGVVSQAPTAAAALADNAQRMARVVAALKRAGIADRDLATANVGLSPQYRYTEGQPPAITGYQATNTVSIRFRDVAKAGGVLDTLVAQGANQIDGPNLSVDAADAALDEARTDAIRRARARAELYAKAAGMRVDRIVSIVENGGGQPPMPMPPMAQMRMVKMADSTPLAAGEQDLTATVSVRFLLR